MLMTLVVQVENKPGVLNRVASLFRRRGFNIESLAVGHTEKPGVSRMTIVIDTDENGALLIEANLYKLLYVLAVENVSRVQSVFRDFAMIKVAADFRTRPVLLHLADVFRARVVDVTEQSLIIEASGSEPKIDRLVGILESYGILEMARTGRVAMVRGTAAERESELATGAEATGQNQDEDQDEDEALA